MYVTVNFMQELAEHLGTDFPDRIRALYPDGSFDLVPHPQSGALKVYFRGSP